MFKISYIVCAGMLISGCSVTTNPLTLEELKSTQASRQQQLMKDQEPIVRPITLYEAMARAIKYNLDYRVEMFEEALRASESKLSNVSLLPQLVATAGLSDRSNYNGSVSSELFNTGSIGAQSDSPSTSSEKSIVNADLRLSWDILDFGLSYVRAKQSADQVLIANERKRKVVNRVIANVRTAYWRAVSAERLVDRLKRLEVDIADALRSSEKSYTNRRTAPLAALTYQRELLKIQQEIQSMEADLMLSKKQLAALMNIDPSSDFQLVVPERVEVLGKLRLRPEQLVNFALTNRPELRELSYEQRINRHEADAALLEVLPNLSLFGGFNHNSNDFLYNNSWVNWGAQASWNIFNAFKYPHKQRVVKVNGEYLDQRALALTMAVMTQVHVSASQFEVAKRRLGTMAKFNTVNNNILEQIVAGHKARKVSNQTLVRERMNRLVSEAKHDMAFADLQNAYADLFTAVGQEVYGDIDAKRSSVDELSKHLQDYWVGIKNSLEGS